jgi:hypothetical protein
MRSKPMVITGAVILLLGLAALFVEGVGYTEEEQILDVGPVEASAETRETFEIPTWAGWAGVAGGALLLVGGALPSRG